ncbi:GumC family protein [Halanaerobium hydrogeniformans]|uniref:Lipopolysaccharide biosynthesis protein n=1 Tax=Halanaerobium hydrogeniformans TaxID=656519 RepID=E4RPJ6_HALHG|nr:GNVR domain-containing protein [Halanaerobium hydrogeniformans]ADQ14019.1 lipopolysaccharide biosynthesis protein [Halanaerobium hydrogeniformans]
MQDDYINNEEIYEIDLREYLMIIWHKKWLIIALVAIAIIASFFLTQQMERIYQTSTLVMVQTDSGAASLFEEQLAFGGRNEKTINTYSRIFTSRLILDKVIRDVELKNEAGEYISAGALRGNISIQSGGESDLMTIEVEYNDPAIAQKIADSLVENMQYEIRELNQASLRAANEFIDSQLENTQHRLLDLEDELLDYRENNEILMPETQAQSLLSRSTELEAKLLEAEIMQEEAQLSINEINNTLESVDRDESLNRNPEITEIQSQLNTLYTELEGLKTKYTKKHPEVLNIQARIDSLEARLREKTEEIMAGRIERTDPLYSDFNNQLINLEVQMVTSEAKVNSYRDLAAEVEEELAAFPAAELHYLRLQREKNITEEIYLLLRNRKEEISIQQAMQTSDIFVIDAAHLPTNPVRPNLTLNIAIAAVLALMLAVFIIFMLEFLNNRIKNENDLENISDLPVLGIIPDLDEIDHHKNYGEEDQDEKEK